MALLTPSQAIPPDVIADISNAKGLLRQAFDLREEASLLLVRASRLENLARASLAVVIGQLPDASRCEFLPDDGEC
jgi:hypothetical protein